MTLIHSKTFRFISKINTLKLNGNNIRFIDKYEFQNMTYLFELDLKNNQLQYLNSNLFKGCKNLKKLCLYGNDLPNDTIINADTIENEIFASSCSI